MIHSKDFEVLQQFLRDYKREIHGRALVGKVKMSQKAIALALDRLKKEGILKYRKQGSLKLYSINMENERAKDMIIMLETIKKMEFLRMHPKLSAILKQDNRIVGIFGSYARGNQRENSDTDLFIVGRKKKEDYDKKGLLLDLNISIKYFSESQFKNLLKSKNNLINEIVNNHTIMFGIERFVDMSWRQYYDLD